MLTKTNYSVDQTLLSEAIRAIGNADFKTTINKPTGNFFYDPWVIKDEYKDTVWEKLLSTIKEPIGEARFIILPSQMSYHSHADIDDRFHLNLKGEMSYLIDLDNNATHKLNPDGIWYSMDAGRIHTAGNFGRSERIQLVVRKTLIHGNIKNPIHVKILSNNSNIESTRFIFDNKISPWLNMANKKRIIDNFTHSQVDVEFDLEKEFVKELKTVAGIDFRIEQ